MENKVSVTDVARRFADYINRVAYRGERFVLLRGNRPVAELHPVSAGRQLRELPDLLRSLPHLSEEEARSFDEDLSKERSLIFSGESLKNPWES